MASLLQDLDGDTGAREPGVLEFCTQEQIDEESLLYAAEQRAGQAQRIMQAMRVAPLNKRAVMMANFADGFALG